MTAADGPPPVPGYDDDQSSAQARRAPNGDPERWRDVMATVRDRRDQRRSRFHFVIDVLFHALRFSRRHARTFVGAVGVFLVGGATATLLGLWAFATVASQVVEGHTQQFDESILTWLNSHQTPLATLLLREVTHLGTAMVVIVLVSIAGTFLWLTQHRYSAILLLVSTIGAVMLNALLKAGFDRPRPSLFEHGTTTASSSFPSGHAMSAAAVYGTVAYLAARLQKRVWSRVLTFTLAALAILLICLSRMVLGVHYPSDVAGGVAFGLAWAGFCMAALEALQRYAERNAPAAAARDEVREGQ